MDYNDLLKQQAQWDKRATLSQAKAAQAFARLLDLAETNTGQAARVRSFVAASFNGSRFAFDLFDLRALDVEISDDILACMDALRWAKADLYKLVPDGLARVQEILASWKIDPAATVQPES